MCRSNSEFWTGHHTYDGIVRGAWSIPVHGSPMFVLYRKLFFFFLISVYRKLGALKLKLKKLNWEEMSDLSSRVADTRATLVAIHESLLSRDSRGELGMLEKEAARKFNMLVMLEEILTRQKVRVRWLELEDRNTTFFLRNLKRRHNRNMIRSMTCEMGCCF